MGGYIGSRASVVSSGAERKQTYAITTTTTSLTGLAYTPTKVHVYHNGIRLVDGTDYTATDGTSITLTTAAENGDEVVVISYATFQVSDTVSAANGGTFAGNVEHTGTLTASGDLNAGTIKDATGTNTALTIDSNGHVLLPKVPAFYVRKTSIQTAAAANEVVVWGEELLDQGGNFASNQFTCPVDGVYFFSVQWLSPSDSIQHDVYLRKNQSSNIADHLSVSRNAGSTGGETTTINHIGYFASGDTVDVIIAFANDSIYGDASKWTTFMGYMIG